MQHVVSGLLPPLPPLVEHPVSHTDLPVLVLVRPVVDANTEFVHVGHTIAAIALVELQQLSVQPLHLIQPIDIVRVGQEPIIWEPAELGVI